MAINDPRDKWQGYSGINRSANPVSSRHNRPGGTADVEEKVDLNKIDASRARGLNENAMPGSVSGHDPSSHGEEGGGELSKGDFPYACPRDSSGTDKADTSLMESQLKYEWGREVPELNCCRWEEFAKNPGYKIELPSANAIQHNPGMEKTLHEYKTGALHSGSKKGPVVKSRAQAIAIGMSEAGKSNQ